MSDIELRLPIITLWQPWAQWVALGWKTIETRKHKKFASLVGKRIGIHAALRWDDAALDLAGEFLTPAERSATTEFLRVGGAVICEAFVREHRELNTLDNRDALIDCMHITRYGLILKDVRIIEAIPQKGKQGIWYMNPEVKP
jgi:hypothetical protein